MVCCLLGSDVAILRACTASRPGSSIVVPDVGEVAETRELTVDAGQLARRARDATVHDDGVERVVGRVRSVEGETQLAQSLVNTIHRYISNRSRRDVSFEHPRVRRRVA